MATKHHGDPNEHSQGGAHCLCHNEQAPAEKQGAQSRKQGAKAKRAKRSGDNGK